MSSHSIVKLSGENFFEWKFVLEGFFLEEGIDITKKIGDEKLNGKALRLIRQSSGPEIIPHIEGVIDANAAWTLLGVRYGQVSIETRKNLLRSIQLERGNYSTTSTLWNILSRSR